MTDRVKISHRLMAIVATALIGWCGTSVAQSIITSPPQNAAEIEAYWTPERMASAIPMPLKVAPSGTPAASVAPVGGQSVSSPGRDSSDNSGAAVQLFDPAMQTTFGAEVSFSPMGEGTFLAPFTSNRLATTSMQKNTLYRRAGKMFFTQHGTDYVCSASAVSYRVVATAGHCLHSGNGLGSGWSYNVVFVPAFHLGLAPYQSWTSTGSVTSTDWYNSGGIVPNGHDYGMFTVSDRLFGTTIKKLGKAVGFFGWRTLSLSRNHVHMLGYPCNLDACQRMHEVTAGDFRDVFPNNVEYGSDARGGSSGGPWVQNFGLAAVGQADIGNRNQIVGITSYGYVSTDPKVQGSSILDDVWVAIWTVACGGAGNCTP